MPSASSWCVSALRHPLCAPPSPTYVTRADHASRVPRDLELPVVVCDSHESLASIGHVSRPCGSAWDVVVGGCALGRHPPTAVTRTVRSERRLGPFLSPTARGRVADLHSSGPGRGTTQGGWSPGDGKSASSQDDVHRSAQRATVAGCASNGHYVSGCLVCVL